MQQHSKRKVITRSRSRRRRNSALWLTASPLRAEGSNKKSSLRLESTLTVERVHLEQVLLRFVCRMKGRKFFIQRTFTEQKRLLSISALLIGHYPTKAFNEVIRHQESTILIRPKKHKFHFMYGYLLAVVKKSQSCQHRLLFYDSLVQSTSAMSHLIIGSIDDWHLLPGVFEWCQRHVLEVAFVNSSLFMTSGQIEVRWQSQASALFKGHLKISSHKTVQHAHILTHISLSAHCF